MKTKSFTPRTIGLTAAAVCLASLALVPTAQAQLQVTAQKIGRPIWKPLDFHLFGAQVGTPGDGFAELYANLQKVLPPPNHVLNPELGIGPGAAHPPPYDHEIANGIAAAGFLETTNFHNSDFNLPNGVWLFWMTVPDTGAPTGKTVDYARGPMIPNNLFPIHMAADTFHDGVMDGPTTTFDAPALTELHPPFDVDGASHAPWFLISTEFGKKFTQGKAGAWEYRISLTDAQGNGWLFTVQFQISPKN